jgi:hypothetical protein
LKIGLYANLCLTCKTLRRISRPSAVQDPFDLSMARVQSIQQNQGSEKSNISPLE